MSFTSRSLQLFAWQQCTQRTLQAAKSGHITHHINTWVTPAVQQRAFGSSNLASSSHTSIYAACVLERLPVVKSPPPAWEAEYKAWTQLRKMNEQLMKQYPMLEKSQRGRDDSEQADLRLTPTVTRADATGDVTTMKRRLTDKLVLLIKQRQAAGSSTDAWSFPTTAHQAGETIRETAERALREAIGPSQVYFVGNAPMAHLDLGSSSSNSTASAPAAIEEANSSSTSKAAARVFFHLAQVVNDPWEVTLADSAAADYAWVGRQELAQYIQDKALLTLALRML